MTRVDRDQAPAPGSSRGAGNVLAVMDFDGTVTARDCMVAVLERYVEDWPRVAAAARAEGLGELAVIERGIGMLRLPRDQIVAAFVETAELRPGLGRFVDWLLGAGGSAAIVGAGIREAIESVLQANGLPAIPVFAAELGGDSVRGYTLALHEDFGDCPVCGSGRCKGALARGLRRPGQVVVAFGDGGRDLCMAKEADLVFARGRLLRLCEREGIPARELTDFDAAAVELAAWLDGGALTGAMPVA